MRNYFESLLLGHSGRCRFAQKEAGASDWSVRYRKSASDKKSILDGWLSAATRKSSDLIFILILTIFLLASSTVEARQRLKARDDIEQFLIDTALTQAVKRPVQFLQKFVDIFFSALHRGQAAGVFACQGFRARPEKRDKKIFAVVSTDHCNTVSSRWAGVLKPNVLRGLVFKLNATRSR